LPISANVERSGSEEPQLSMNVGAEDSILSDQVFALQKQALVDKAGDVRQ
jgi:hypothetical protein